MFRDTELAVASLEGCDLLAIIELRFQHFGHPISDRAFFLVCFFFVFFLFSKGMRETERHPLPWRGQAYAERERERHSTARSALLY